MIKNVQSYLTYKVLSVLELEMAGMINYLHFSIMLQWSSRVWQQFTAAGLLLLLQLGF